MQPGKDKSIWLLKRPQNRPHRVEHVPAYNVEKQTSVKLCKNQVASYKLHAWHVGDEEH